MADSTRDDEFLREENERLLRRVEELERMLAARADAHLAGASAWKAFEDARFSVAIRDAGGRLVWANRRYDEVWGRAPTAELPDERRGDFAACDRDAFERALKGEIVRMTPCLVQTRKPQPGGSEDRGTWMERTMAPIETEMGTSDVIELGFDVSIHVQEEQFLRESRRIVEDLLDNSPTSVYSKDLNGRYLWVNRTARRIFGMQLKQLKGKTDHDIFPAELADSIAAADRIVIQSMKDSAYEDAFFVNDTMHHFVTTKFPIFDTAGRVYGVGCITTDITHLKLAENENRRLQEEIIRAQGETLRALSTPLLPIAPGVVVMPLIGNIDSNRAQRALETLLDGILKYQAAIVILDVTGVPIVDAHVASALVQTAQAVKLLGADVVLTGIQPKIARALIDLGIDLASIRTEGTLRGGIARALKG